MGEEQGAIQDSAQTYGMIPHEDTRPKLTGTDSPMARSTYCNLGDCTDSTGSDTVWLA